MIVGLTGGLATGKTLVAQELKRLGARIIDADAVSREIVEPGKPAYLDIIKEFGEVILAPDKTLDRKALGRIVFSDKEKLQRLNAITHPRIIEQANSVARELDQKDPDGIVIIDAALMIETGMKHNGMKKLIVVYADAQTQVKRAINRDGLTEQEAFERVCAQMPIDEKVRRADFVIDNSKDESSTLEQTAKLYFVLKGIASAGDL